MMKKLKRRKNSKLLKLAVIFISICMLFVLVDNQIRPVVTALAQSRIKSVTLTVINNAVIDTMIDYDISYDDISNIELSETGEVNLIAIDTVTVNMLKASIVAKIQESIQDTEFEELNIPIGSLSGIQILSGRGPKITLKIMPFSMIDTAIYSEFESVGINQTLHKVNIKITIDAYAIIPGYTTSVTVESDICIAETVIVGVVPDSFTYVGEEDDGSIANKINDYGAY